MELGAFPVSLAVRNIKASVAFYEKPGFTGQVGDAVMALFQGIFKRNAMTFNPGWNQDAQAVCACTGVRVLQQELKDAGVKFPAGADTATEGPAGFIIAAPDGNPAVLVQDCIQHASERLSNADGLLFGRRA